MRKIYYSLNGVQSVITLPHGSGVKPYCTVLWDEINGPAPQNIVDAFEAQESQREADKASKHNAKRASMKALKNANSVQDLKAVLKAVIEHLGMEAE